jgi:hypothetical protein
MFRVLVVSSALTLISMPLFEFTICQQSNHTNLNIPKLQQNFLCKTIPINPQNGDQAAMSKNKRDFSSMVPKQG